MALSAPSSLTLAKLQIEQNKTQHLLCTCARLQSVEGVVPQTSIHQMLHAVMHGEAASSVKWDALQQAPFFNYNKEGTVHQVS